MAASTEDGQVADNKMYRPPQQEQTQLNFEEIIERLRASIPKLPGIGGGGVAGLILAAVVVIAIIWAATGFYTVGPDEQAVLRTFGKITGTESGGLHWYYPGPIGRRDVVAITTTRRLELGFRSGADGFTVAQSVTNESLMITGDVNIVDVQAVIQYNITDLEKFLIKVDDPGDPDRGIQPGSPDGRTLRDIAETALRQVVGARNIDDVLTTEKEQVQTDVLFKMRELAATYETGINVQVVLLQNVNPPLEVQSAFEDVVRAREDRERLINLAEAYQAAEIPKAIGEAAKVTEAAEGFKTGRIARAQGEADGFEAILAGYLNSPVVTRQRLYLEAMEDILPGIKKFILSDSSVLPFLPLDGSTPGAGTIIGAGGGQ
ncbi:MAG: FtsH protease activity modulator HflK [Chloroflexi bacterium]|nr:FtsH protease activity modulator HflK [Chloroflexota bacterium]